MSIPEGVVPDKSSAERVNAAENGSNTGAKSVPFWKDWTIVTIIVLTGALCFGLGLLAQKQNAKSSSDPFWIEQLPASELPGSISSSSVAAQNMPAATTSPKVEATPTSPVTIPAQPAAAVSAISQTGNYVASKSGTKYYLPTCSTVKRIKDENKVWFATKAQAEAAGYGPGANCPGL